MLFRSFVFPAGHLEVNLFVMGDEKTSEGLLVDAGVFDQSVVDFVEGSGLKLSTILLTHHHGDHIDGLKDYLRQWDASVISPAPIKTAPQAQLVKEGDRFEVGPFEFEVFQTSGHTPESISYYCAAQEVCFVGDALFAGSVGGTKDDDLHAEEIGHIKRNLLALPPETEIYSGHGPATTIAIEKASNPFLQPGFTRLP